MKKQAHQREISERETSRQRDKTQMSRQREADNVTGAQTGLGRNQANTNTNDSKDRRVVMWVSQAGRQLQVLVFALHRRLAQQVARKHLCLCVCAYAYIH